MPALFVLIYSFKDVVSRLRGKKSNTREPGTLVRWTTTNIHIASLIAKSEEVFSPTPTPTQYPSLYLLFQSYCTLLGGSLLSPTSAQFQLTSEGALRRSKGKPTSCIARKLDATNIISLALNCI